MAHNSSATDSDHKPIACSIPYPMTARKHVREKPTPINWYLSDPMFNHSICDELGIEADDRLDSGLSDADNISAHRCFTDGSFIRGQGAGWAFNVFPRGDSKGEGKPFLPAAGPILTLRKSMFSCGGGSAYFRGCGNQCCY